MSLTDLPLFPESASTLAREVDSLYFFALAVSAFFSLLIAVCIFVFFVKYRRRDPTDAGAPIRGSILLEVVWSIVPLGITMVLFVWGSIVFYHQRTAPSTAREYYATGKQWMWKFQHPEGQREINTLHVPLGEPIRLQMTSEDVIHSFYVPAFRVKQDVLPGRYTSVWFEATRPGTYHLFCAEYCGEGHSRMIGRVIVMEQDAYAAWLAGGAPSEPPASIGEKLFAKHICNTCHLPDGSGQGPSLVGIYGSTVELEGGGSVVVDDAYLRESILDPRAKIVAGRAAVMPPFQGQISEVGLMQLIAYIKSLSGVDQGSSAPGTAAPAADDMATPQGSDG